MPAVHTQYKCEISAAFVNSLSQYVHEEKTEKGGNATIQMQDHALVIRQGTKLASGTYQSVFYAPDIVDWHTHPDACLRARHCTIGLPSRQDIHNVLLSRRRNHMCHLMASRDGIYVLSGHNAQVSPAWSANVDILFNKYNVEDDMTLKKYQDLQKEYMANARLVGIQMQLLPWHGPFTFSVQAPSKLLDLM
jgi:hypothetical protein